MPHATGIAPLYAIEGPVQVALDHAQLAAIDGDLVVEATLLHALIMDADRDRAFVRDPPVRLEPEHAAPASPTAPSAYVNEHGKRHA